MIGSAGSGKTALTLEKMKDAPGEVLYVTRSPYLVHNSRKLYYALEYENDAQDVSFLSFAEYLASLRVPQGREMSFRDFTQWFARHRAASHLKDPHPLFEEFQGVITGPCHGPPLPEPGGVSGPGHPAIDLCRGGTRRTSMTCLSSIWRSCRTTTITTPIS